MIIVFGKTASGKSTLVNELAKRGYKKIVTYTTRPPRTGEKDGMEYHFVEEEDFLDKAGSNFFAEWKIYNTEHGEWYYGSPFNDILNADDKSVIILTPEGYRNIKDKIGEHKSIYIHTNNQTIKQRLISRGDNKDEAERRILADNSDFKKAEKLADRIFYNNSGKDFGVLVNEVFNYLEG